MNEYYEHYHTCKMFVILLDFGFHLQWATNFFITCPFFFIYCIYALHIHIINITCIHLDLYICIYIVISLVIYGCVCQSFLIKRNQKVCLVFVLNAQLVACVFFLLCLYLISNTRIYIYTIYICSMYNSYKCLCSMSGVILFVCLLCCLDLNIQNITLSQFSFIYSSISLIAMSNLHFVFDFYIFAYIWNVHVHATITRICLSKITYTKTA